MVIADFAPAISEPMPLIIVIPARNEAEVIGDVISEIMGTMPVDVLVVDDASSDDTAARAARAGARVIKLSMSLGAWGATQTGIRYALREGYKAVVTMDADGQHESAYLRVLLDPLRKERVDVVVGAYPERGSVARQVAWGMFRKLAGFDLADLTSGFRAYNMAAMKVLASTEAILLDYQDLGVLILLRRAGLRIEEVPVAMRPRKNGTSRVFGSWWKVTAYMLHTVMLCLARWKVERR